MDIPTITPESSNAEVRLALMWLLDQHKPAPEVKRVLPAPPPPTREEPVWSYMPGKKMYKYTNPSTGLDNFIPEDKVSEEVRLAVGPPVREVPAKEQEADGVEP